MITIQSANAEPSNNIEAAWARYTDQYNRMEINYSLYLMSLRNCLYALQHGMIEALPNENTIDRASAPSREHRSK